MNIMRASLFDDFKSKFDRSYDYITNVSRTTKNNPEFIELVRSLNDMISRWEVLTVKKEKLANIFYDKKDEGIDPHKWFLQQKRIISSKISRLHQFTRLSTLTLSTHIKNVASYFTLRYQSIVEAVNEFFASTGNEFKLTKEATKVNSEVKNVEIDALDDKGIKYSDILSEDLLPEELKLMPTYLTMKQENLYALLLAKTKKHIAQNPNFSIKELFKNYVDQTVYDFEALKIKASEELTDEEDIAKNNSIIKQLDAKIKKIKTLIMPIVDLVDKKVSELKKEVKEENTKETSKRRNDEIEKRNVEIVRRAKEFLTATNQNQVESVLKKYNGGGDPQNAYKNAAKYLSFLQSKLEPLRVKDEQLDKEKDRIDAFKREIDNVISFLDKNKEAEKDIQQGKVDIVNAGLKAGKQIAQNITKGVKSSASSLKSSLSKEIGINK